jgi:uncharacterized membrane protein YbhN (UPF0104 family)
MTTLVMAPRTSRAVAGFAHAHARGLVTAAVLAASAATARAMLPTHVVATAKSAVASWLSSTDSALTWTTALCLSLMIGLQYLAAAVSARAAAGVELPYGELVAVQLAGTAANSVTPVGLGGATLNGRYFARRGRLQPAQSAAAVSVLAVFGGTADLLAFAVLVGLGSLVGLAGASDEVPLLGHRLVGLFPAPSPAWLWVLGALATIAGVIATSSLRRTHLVQRAATGARSYFCTIALLIRRPARMAVLMGASASTTLLMALAFATIAILGPAALPASTAGALMIGYMLASAAGNAVPTPGGIGAADAAFTGVLLAAHVPLATAVGTVLAYRLVTLWAPVAVGALLVRPLRRRGAL